MKAAAIVVTSVFFVEVFFATKDLLGWPRTGQLPARFQLLWVRVVEPDSKTGDRGAIYLWIEEVDENNVPDACRAPIGCPIRARSPTARPRRATRSSAAARSRAWRKTSAARTPRRPRRRSGSRSDSGLTTVDLEQFQLLQQAQRVEFAPMPLPTPPKVP